MYHLNYNALGFTQTRHLPSQGAECNWWLHTEQSSTPLRAQSIEYVRPTYYQTKKLAISSNYYVWIHRYMNYIYFFGFRRQAAGIMTYSTLQINTQKSPTALQLAQLYIYVCVCVCVCKTRGLVENRRIWEHRRSIYALVSTGTASDNDVYKILKSASPPKKDS